jgi:hypothetical protein
VAPSPEKKIPHNGFVDVDFLEKGKVRQPARPIITMKSMFQQALFSKY